MGSRKSTISRNFSTNLRSDLEERPLRMVTGNIIQSYGISSAANPHTKKRQAYTSPEKSILADCSDRFQKKRKKSETTILNLLEIDLFYGNSSILSTV